MAQVTVGAVAVVQKGVATGFGLQHVGEIFSTHGGLLLQHPIFPDHLRHHLAGKRRFGMGVDRGWIVARKFEVNLHTMGLCQVLRDVPHALLHLVQNTKAERPHSSLQLDAVRNDVGRLPCVHHGDGYHRGIDGAYIAAHDGLKRQHQLTRGRYRIYGGVRHGSVPALATQHNPEFVAGRHDRPATGRKLPHLTAGPVVHAKDSLYRKLFKQAVTDHFTRPATAFFCRLEHQVNRAVKVAVAGQVLRSSKQHRGVAIVPARVHLARVLAGVRKGIALLHGQRVHVGPQSHRTRAGSSPDDTHHPRGAQPGVNLDAPALEGGFHRRGGAHLRKAEFRVCMKVPADRSHGGRVVDNFGDELHEGIIAPRAANGSYRVSRYHRFMNVPIPPISGTREVLGVCPHDCPDTCSMLTTVQDGVAIKVHGNPLHPHTNGSLCTKVSRYTERTYHPDRLLHPMRRVGPKGPGARFEPVGWDEALRDIARRLQAIATDPALGPEAILPYSYAGTMGLVQGDGMAARFMHRLGASLLDRTVCAAAGAEALMLTLGSKRGMRVEEFANAQLILIWGSNPITSSVHFWRYAQEGKRNGARLVCIDPRRSETAERCHEHIALLPGTDAALALAMMHELIQNNWLDHDYIARYTHGFDALRDRALQWPPERAAAICGVTAQQIRQLAAEYGQAARNGQGVAVRLNYGMQRVRGGGNAVRAVACLPALVGAWRRANGGLLLSSSGNFSPRRDALQRPDLLGARRPRTLNMSDIGNHLCHGGGRAFGPPVKAVVVYNSNPVAIAPDSGSVAKGFAREDLFTVVLEHFQTDTADYADYVLPATTQLEHWDIHTAYGHTDVQLNQPAIAPLGQAKSNAQIFRELAAHMGFDEPCFNDSDETMCRTAFGDSIDFGHLLVHGFVSMSTSATPFADGGFGTPTGKCEFVSTVLQARGLDGLPDHIANYEAAGAVPAYPLAMISPPARNFLNSSFVNVASLQALEKEPVLEIHPTDAEARGIADGQMVRVFNSRGATLCRARVGARARIGVVNGLGVWWRKLGVNGTNVNELTHQGLTDLGAGPCFYDCAVEVELL